MNALRIIFEEKLTEETREPLWSFDALNYHVDFLPPNYKFFVQILVVSTGVSRANECVIFTFDPSHEFAFRHTLDSLIANASRLGLGRDHVLWYCAELIERWTEKFTWISPWVRLCDPCFYVVAIPND